MAKTDSIKTDFYINYLTQAQFDAAVTNNEIDADQLYLVPDTSITSITAGTGLSGGGSSGAITLNHSNSVTAKTTQGFYPISFDAQGHITGAGNAITPITSHNTAYLYVGTSSGSANAATTNGNTYFILADGGSVTSRRKISGTQNVSISSNSSGEVLITGPDLSSYALKSEIPTVSYPVTSVNSKTGAVSLTYSDVGAAASGHTHTTSIAESTGTNQITLGYGKKYSLTAGGTSYVFTMPSADDTNTWRTIQVNGSDILTGGTGTGKLNLKAGTNVSISNSNGTVTISSTDTNTDTNTTYTLSGALSSHKFTSTLTAGGSGSGTSTSDITFVAGSNITLTDDTSARTITIAATDTNTHNTAYLYAGASNGTANAATTNGNTYLILVDGSSTTRRKISGATNISVTSDSSGNITITGPDLSSYAKTSQIPSVNYPVTSVNSKTGAVSLTYSDVGAAASSHSHNYAGSSSAGGSANSAVLVNGTYSGNGGAQPPSFVSGGQVKFAMMNNPKGITGFPTYADTIIMDTYTGSDVPWTTGLGIIKQDANPRMFIFNGAKGNTTTWKNIAEVLTSKNWSSFISIPTSLPASDVYSWAKASSKPSYSSDSVATGITASTTATKTTLGTAFTIPNVTSVGSASTWAFTGVTVANSISGAVDANDSTQLNITLGTTTVQSKSSGGNGTAPTLGTAFTVPNVTGNTSATVSITDPKHSHTIS